MKNQTIELSKLYHIQGGKLFTYAGDYPSYRPMSNWKRPAVIVCPGGGYAQVCTAHEGEPIALRFSALGYQTFVLYYDCAPQNAKFPNHLLTLACAVDYLKRHAEEYAVNPKEIFVVGFSAGAHLCGNLSTDYTLAQKEYGEPLDCQVAGAGLCYPVISPDYGHVGSFDNVFFGMTEEKKAANMPKVKLDKNVCERTAPAFIWTTVEDLVVPPINALSYATALQKQGISYELHIYPQGDHGLAACDLEHNVGATFVKRYAKWFDDCDAFFRLYVEEQF